MGYCIGRRVKYLSGEKVKNWANIRKASLNVNCLPLLRVDAAPMGCM